MTIIISGESTNGEVVTWYFPKQQISSIQLVTKQGTEKQVVTITTVAGKATTFWSTAASADFESVWDSYMKEYSTGVVMHAAAWRPDEPDKPQTQESMASYF